MAVAREGGDVLVNRGLLSIKTFSGEEFKGEVICYDPTRNILVLEESLKAGPRREFRILKGNHIMDVSYLGEADKRDLNSVLHLVQAGAEVAREEEEGEELEECCAKSRQRRSLPEDTVFDILMRVPARRLTSLKRVCKLWENIIQNREFARAHLKYWKSKSIPEFIGRFRVKNRLSYEKDLVICNFFDAASLDIETMTYHGLKDIETMTCLGPKRNMRLLDSADGLVILLHVWKEILVYNPLTLNLNKLQFETGAADFLLCEANYKLVFDSVLQKYKLLVFCLYRNCYCVLILNGDGRMENPIWRKTKTPFYMAEESALVATRGNLYWIAYDSKNRNEMYYIESFDIVKEEFNNRIQLPRQPNVFTEDGYVFTEDGYFVDSDTGCSLIQMETPGEGSLLVAIYRSIPSYETRIWILKDWDKHNWDKLYTFDTKVSIVLFVMNNQNSDEEIEFFFRADRCMHRYRYSLQSRVMTKTSEYISDIFNEPILLLTPSLVSWA